jgi:hypothetical protein
MLTASRASPEVPMPEVDAKLLHCDLCILAYQNYHQAVIWPLDPWYEVLARGASDRRALFMTAVHALAAPATLADPTAIYGGPMQTRAGFGASNDKLDPIITNYTQINPKLAAFTGDGSKYLVLQVPDYITANLRRVRLAHCASPNATTLVELQNYGAGSDEMIVFEGATGVLGSAVGALSPMGFVLARYNDAGNEWEAHIVFRGSRSGSAARALKQGLGGSGNPDWVTDMASAFVTSASDVASVGGSAASGMVHAMQTCAPSLLAALHALATGRGAPKKVHVTGHSLGAALASTLSAALTLTLQSSGSPLGKTVREGALRSWPWESLQGWYFALPPTGNKAFCDLFNSKIESVAPYCDGDPVVECSKSIGTMDTASAGRAGWALGSGGYSAGKLEKLAKPANSTGDENPHEIYLIRAALVTQLGRNKLAAPVRDALPWGVYETFRDLLDGRAANFRKTTISIITRQNLAALLQAYHFAAHFDLMLGMLDGVVSNKGAYRGVHKSSTLQRLGENVQLARSLELADAGDDSTVASIVDRVATQVSILCAFSAAKQQYLGLGSKAKVEKDGTLNVEADDMLGQDFSVRIGLGMLLRALEKYPRTTMADYEKMEVLRLCLDTKVS